MVQKVLTFAVFLSLELLCAHSFATVSPFVQLETVFDISRSNTEDIVYFRNKDILRGLVLNEEVTVATQYGMLSVPLGRCAGISLEGARTNTEAVVLVNFNRITGIITDHVIRFRIGSSGTEIPIRKEKIRSILLKRTPDETDFLKDHEKADLFIMANGDVLSGEAVERKVVVRTDYGEVPVSFAEMKDVQMQGGENVTAVITKTNGDTMRGTLETEEISLQLEIGLDVPTIYKDKFAKILVDQARTQAPLQFGVQQPVLGESDGVSPVLPVLSDQRTITLDLGNQVTMKLVLIPAGKFLMGSPSDEVSRGDDEGPQREVTISRPFYMGIHEVTQAQYEGITGSNPSEFGNATGPVERVSWENATEFCKELSQKTGKKVILPTEAQWEYACRAGSRTRFCFGDDEKRLDAYAWFGRSGDDRTNPVARKKPNAWGLYDMHGNVWEWCSDWYAGPYVNAPSVDPAGATSGQYRVLRGGSRGDSPVVCRSAHRGKESPRARASSLGFRVVLNSE